MNDGIVTVVTNSKVKSTCLISPAAIAGLKRHERLEAGSWLAWVANRISREYMTAPLGWAAGRTKEVFLFFGKRSQEQFVVNFVNFTIAVVLRRKATL